MGEFYNKSPCLPFLLLLKNVKLLFMKNYSHYVYLINSLEKPATDKFHVRASLIDSAFEFSDVKDYLDRHLYKVNSEVVRNLFEYARRQQKFPGDSKSQF